MECLGYMSERVMEKIGGLQRRFGVEESETLAFWHLRQDKRLMIELRKTGTLKRLRRKGSNFSPAGASGLAGR